MDTGSSCYVTIRQVIELGQRRKVYVDGILMEGLPVELFDGDLIIYEEPNVLVSAIDARVYE